jgi:hypothetical protein
MPKWRKEKTQINKFRAKTVTYAQIITKSRESLESTLKTHSSKVENLDKMDKFIDVYNTIKIEPKRY